MGYIFSNFGRATITKVPDEVAEIGIFWVYGPRPFLVETGYLFSDHFKRIFWFSFKIQVIQSRSCRVAIGLDISKAIYIRCKTSWVSKLVYALRNVHTCIHVLWISWKCLKTAPNIDPIQNRFVFLSCFNHNIYVVVDNRRKANCIKRQISQ